MSSNVYAFTRRDGETGDKKAGARHVPAQRLGEGEGGKGKKEGTVVNVSVDVIFRDVWGHMQDYPNWNHHLQRVEVVLDITPRCRLVYQVLHPVGNGIIWSRDIVAIMYWDKEGDGIYISLASTSWPALPPSSQYVRATFYPQGYVYAPMPGDPEKTLIRLVHHIDVHLAFIPAPVISLILAKTGRDTVMQFRDHLENLRKEFTGLGGV
ncbi:unnamed protein product [Darwinula stevensoni]|uniref:START domain-containing protein n=1 Tax=Darwinula stevensoni TaxID=69355 RepID=A0A7R9AFK0_9CRUS|nr:unnamed protein product [Darwinula stevensoni]CAG0903361.1 unnamed protein product [Darwinula stevensoni]